jgi:hypothetical protein
LKTFFDALILFPFKKNHKILCGFNNVVIFVISTKLL